MPRHKRNEHYRINPSAVCRLPSAVCRYYSNKWLLWCLIATGILVFSSVFFVAKAALVNCHALNTGIDFQPTEIALPDDFDSLPLGTLVSKHFHVKKEMECHSTSPNDVAGVKHWLPPGFKVVNIPPNLLLGYPYLSDNSLIKMYTVPELEARGLGFIIIHNSSNNFYSTILALCSNNINGWIGGGGWDNINMPQNDQTIWAVRTTGQQCPDNPYDVRLRFHINYTFNLVKIGHSSQHATLPQNFMVILYRQTGLLQSAPSVPVTTQEITWSITNFSENVSVRACTTPTASESTIHFGHHQQSVVQSMSGGATFAEREFTLTFVCPRKAYDNISFTVEPVYGINSAYPGTMNIAQGDGMAKGVGVQLHVNRLFQANPWAWDNTAFTPVNYRMGNAQYNTDATAWLQYNTYPLFLSIPNASTYPNSWNAQDYHLLPGEDATITRVVNFKANLIRLPVPVQPGQIKALALIHIRYN